MKFLQAILTLLTVSLFLTCSMGQDVKECPTSECGAPLLMLNYLCPDGVTTAGPSGRCLDTGNGCQWEVITCPETECASDSDCTSSNEKRFCQKSSCSDEKGKCASTGTGICTMIYAPVCGCDGKTYASRCVATAAGVNIQHAGACDGSECSFDGACKNGSFCERPNCTATGICQPRPEVCQEIYDPVCGCDGKTHGNKCSANSAGVNVQYPGECAKQNETGRCTESSQCSKGFFCSKKSCDAEYGVCAQSEGLICTKIYDPVCGCDGQTYGSACAAQQNAQNVAYAGECKTDPPSGTKCSQSSDCDEGSFCSKEACDAESGECVNPAAVLCPAIYDPVCGCDGKTYASSCNALLNRTNVQYKGECDECSGCTPIYLFVPCADGSRGYKCVLNDSQCVTQLTNCPVAVPTRGLTCSSNDDCADGSFCSKPTCTSESGQCVQSEGIFCPAIYDPVCGCDGKTYGSACTARTNQQNVDYAGECKNTEEEDPKGGSCSADSECGEGSFCQKRFCNSRSGKCTQYGLYLCPYIYDPVCGCDGVTYPSSCQAINMGKNIRYKGECRSRPTPTTAENGKRCRRDSQCGPNSICQKDTCQSLTGKCQRYDTIRCSTIHDPVCGCDGNTYSNACLALVAGQNVDPNGTCQKTKRNLMENQNNQRIHRTQRRNLKRK